MEGEWSCYRSGHFNEGRMVSLMEGERSCYGGGQFKWPVSRRVWFVLFNDTWSH